MTHVPASRTWRQRLVWPGMLFALVGALVVTDVTMIVVATGDETFALAEGAADPAADWASRRAEQAASDRLGWTSEIAVVPGAGRDARVLVRVLDADGAPLDDLAVEAELFHHARAHARRTVRLEADGDGRYRAPVLLGRAGRWSVEIAASRGDARHVARRDLDLGAAITGSATP